MEIKEKIKKDEETLNQLREKKDKIEQKISLIEARIQKNKILLNDKKFTEINDVIKAKGLTIEEIMQAVKKGDLLEIQDKLMQQDETKKEDIKEVE